MPKINPFESAMEQLTLAAAAMKLAPEIDLILRQPQRIVTVAIPLKLDNGEIKIYEGFRVQYNNARGPYKGGLRYHPQVDISEVKALAFWQSMKNAVVNIPYGGAKGGIAVDPKQLSQAELERLTRKFVDLIYKDIGPQFDIPAPDVNTTPQIMSWIVDEYSSLVKFKTWAVVTGKPLDNGGSEGRNEATGFGGVEILKLAASDLKLPNGATVAIQGFGNVGSFFSELAEKAGFKIVAVSDSKGGIYNPEGLKSSDVIKYKQDTGSVTGFAGSKAVSNEELLELPVDILVPSALENQIHKDNATKIQAKLIIEMANGPTTPEADKILHEKKIVVVPDVLSNSGGVATSYYEWEQNLISEHWSKEEVLGKLTKLMTAAWQDVTKTSQEFQVSFRVAAFILAIRRITEKIKI